MIVKQVSIEPLNTESTELVEEIGGKSAVTDVDPSGNRCVKFWIHDVPTSSAEDL